MNALTKRHGPFPLWLWIALIGAGGYVLYRVYLQRAEPNLEPTGEGLYPTTGLEPASEGAAAPGAGIAELGNELTELAAAGFVPAGSEEAKQEPGFAPPGKLEGLLEEGFGTYLERAIRGELDPGGAPAEKKKGKAKRKAHKQADKGKRSGPKGENHGNHHPGHAKTPNHGAAKHPSQRYGKGSAKPTSKGGQAKSSRAQASAAHTGGSNTGGAHVAPHKPAKPPKPPRPKPPPVHHPPPPPHKQKAHH